MTLFSTIICPQCAQLYDDSLHRTCIGKCHHSICVQCKNSLKTLKCPICDEDRAFSRTETVYNRESVNFLEAFQNRLATDGFERVIWDLKNPCHGSCSKCHTDCRKLRMCTICSKMLIRNFTGTWHCLVDGIKVQSAAICANCAIDHHEAHQVVLLKAVRGFSRSYKVTVLKALQVLTQRDVVKKQVDETCCRFKKDWLTGQCFSLQLALEQRICKIEAPKIPRKLLEHLKEIQSTEFDKKLNSSFQRIQMCQKRLEDLRKLWLIKRLEDSMNARIARGISPKERRSFMKIEANCSLKLIKLLGSNMDYKATRGVLLRDLENSKIEERIRRIQFDRVIYCQLATLNSCQRDIVIARSQLQINQVAVQLLRALINRTLLEIMIRIPETDLTAYCHSENSGGIEYKL